MGQDNSPSSQRITMKPGPLLLSYNIFLLEKRKEITNKLRAARNGVVLYVFC